MSVVTLMALLVLVLGPIIFCARRNDKLAAMSEEELVERSALECCKGHYDNMFIRERVSRKLRREP